MREPYPFLSIEGTEVPDVPQGAYVLRVPLIGQATGGGGSVVLTGLDGAGLSFSAWTRRTMFDANTPTTVRVLGFGVGREANSPTPLPAWIASTTYTIKREPLDPDGNLLTGSPYDDLGLVFGGTSGTPTVLPVHPIPVGGPVPWYPIVPARRVAGLLDSDVNVRFVVTVQDGALLTANTVLRGVLVVAMFPSDPPS